MPWNFHAHLYDAAASYPRVFRLPVGNKKLAGCIWISQCYKIPNFSSYCIAPHYRDYTTARNLQISAVRINRHFLRFLFPFLLQKLCGKQMAE